MAETPLSSVVINDFPGLISNVDPRDIPPGAAELQVNACCLKQGELQVRLGLRPVVFDNQ